MRARRWVPLSFIAASLVALPAQARAGDSAGAQAAFERGLTAFESGRTDEACELFYESMALDPANGTLLNLARCHEKQGRVATAWSEYLQVATLASRRGEHERAAVAAEAAARLKTSLPQVRLVVEAPRPDLVVKRDGVVVSREAWIQPLYVDPGTHLIEAEAPGFGSYTTEVVVPSGGATVEVVIPRLTARPPFSEAASSDKGGGGLSPFVIVAIASGGVAVTTAAVGGVLSAISRSEMDTADSDPALCPNDVCTPRGEDWMDSAEEKARASTALMVIAGLSAATAAAMIGVEIVTADDDEAPTRAVSVTPIVGPGVAGVVATVPLF